MRRGPALFAALVAVLCLLAAAPAARAEPAPMPVAVVDVLQLISKHPDFLKAREILSAKGKQLTDDFEKKDKQLQADKASLNPSGPTAADQLKLLERQAVMAKFDLDWAMRVAQDDFMRALENVFVTVQGLISVYARDHNLALVLQMRGEVRLGPAKSPDEFFTNVALRSVPYYSDALDITKAIVAGYPKAPPAPAVPSAVPSAPGTPPKTPPVPAPGVPR